LARLAVLQPDAVSRARLRDAVGDRHGLIEVADWVALQRVLNVEAPSGCVIDPFAVSPPVPVEKLMRLRTGNPEMALVVFADFTGRGELVARLSPVLDDIIVAGREDEVAFIRSVIADAFGKALARKVRLALADRIPPIEARALAWSIEYATEHPNVRDLADALGLQPSILRRRLREDSGVTPRRILVWGRMFRAAEMLAHDGRAISSTALALGYSSDATFRRAVRRDLAYPPSRIADHGGLEVPLRRFLESKDFTD